MQEEELIATLQMIRGAGIGPVTFSKLIQKYHTPQNVVEYWEPPSYSDGRVLKLESRDTVLKEIESHAQFGAYLIGFKDPRYPIFLRQISDAPPVISVKGRLDLLEKSYVGVVGARNGSLNGNKLARALAGDIGLHGWGVISGLARGIDAAAHAGSLSWGTIAVLAGGIDNIYPNENKALYEAIAEEGLLLSEMAFGAEPQATFFPRRNRIIAGIATGLVVIEAALQSGSLLTAKFALDYGREVFAIPGSPMDPRCRGTNKLLKQGAILVETVHDIMDVLGSKCPEESISPSSKYMQMTSEFQFRDEGFSLEDKVLSTLSAVPLPIDDLCEKLHIPSSLLMSLILELEIKGKINRIPGNLVVRQ